MVKILTVCTGNVCRSPFAERYLAAELDALSPGAFRLSSAGTHALTGKTMDQRAGELLGRAGGTPEGFVARQLNEMLLADVGIVLALTEWHRKAVVSMSPRLLLRSFTVREFARLLTAVTDAGAPGLDRGAGDEDIESRWKKLPRLVAKYRHEAAPPGAGSDDVVDPYRQSNAVYDQMAEELVPALQAIIAFERTMMTG